MGTETVELLAAAGSKTTAVGTGVIGAGWLLSSDGIGLIGVLIGLAGLGINWYYRRESSRRQAEESELRKQETRLRMQLMRYAGKPLDCGDLELIGDLE